MKRYLIGAVPMAVLATFLCAAQESPEAIAARQEAEERFKRLNATVEDLVGSNQALEKRLGVLREELGRLREEVSRANDRNKDTATQESLKQLARAIEEVDQKRLADNDKIVAALAKLEKLISDRSAPSARSNSTAPATPHANPPANKTEKGYEYTIRERDNPHAIAAALKQQGMKVTAQQIMDANPGVQWNKLRIGQKIFIPAPAP
jgi:chromosome segregation ATPase